MFDQLVRLSEVLVLAIAAGGESVMHAPPRPRNIVAALPSVSLPVYMYTLLASPYILGICVFPWLLPEECLVSAAIGRSWRDAEICRLAPASADRPYPHRDRPATSFIPPNSVASIFCVCSSFSLETIVSDPAGKLDLDTQGCAVAGVAVRVPESSENLVLDVPRRPQAIQVEAA